jgi:hypothetical protein
MNNWKLVSDFLIVFWGNDLDEPAIRRLLENHYSMRPDYLERVLEGGKKVLASHDHDTDLQHTIAWAVNVVLDNNAPEGAREWLKERLNTLEEMIGG